MKSIVAVVLAAALTACSTTSVQVLPTGASKDCPAEVRGGFVGIDSGSGKDSGFGVFVDDDCAVLVFDREKDRKAAPVPVDVRWFRAYVLAKRADVDRAASKSAPSSDAFAKESYGYVFGWSRDGDKLSIRHLDHRRVATLIVNGAIAGETHWRGTDGDNLLTGSADDIAGTLERLDLFDRQSAGVLRYVGRDRKALERVLDKAGR